MKLHLNRDAFRVLIEQVSERTGYRQDVIEKDYYVSMLLRELAHFQRDDSLPAYFKGGTALYKALHSVRRFSEDVDLSVDVRDCSRTQGDKRLERATKKYLYGTQSCRGPHQPFRSSLLLSLSPCCVL